MDLTGLSEEQAYELSNWFSLFHPDDLPAAVAGFSHAMQNAVPLHITYRIKRQDGEWIWHESRGNLVETVDGGKMWCCTVSDVEVMVRARQALEVQQARMTAVLDGAGILLFNVGSDLRIRFFEGRLPPIMPHETVFVDRLLRDVWPDPELEKAISQALAAPEVSIVALSSNISLNFLPGALHFHD
jgi:PAS domain S-box-containing protein